MIQSIYIQKSRRYLLFVTLLTIILSTNAKESTLNIVIKSDQYLLYNYVEIDLKYNSGATEKEFWKEEQRRPVKGLVNAIKNPPIITFHANTGSVEQSGIGLENNKWHFNRDSVLMLHGGILKLKVSYTRLNTKVVDSIEISLPKISRIEPQFHKRKSSEYFNNIFENWINIHFSDGRIKYFPAYFHKPDSSFENNTVLANIMVTGDIIYEGGRYKIKYDNPINTKQITFVDRITNQIINTVNVPKSIYILRETFVLKPIELEQKALHGKDGNIYRMDSLTRKVYFQIDKEGRIIDKTSYNLSRIDLNSINGEQGIKGMDGVNGKQMTVKVDRANEVDSIARITVHVDDTVYHYFVDIVNGGSFSIYNAGGHATNGGNGGACGYIESIDSVLYWGIAGHGGAGGNGGDGGNVSIYAQEFYKNYIHNIIVHNRGGQGGKGGKDATQFTLEKVVKAGVYYSTQPYLMLKGEILKTGKLGATYSNAETVYFPPTKYISNRDQINSKASNGKNGATGSVVYIYY